MICSQHQRFDRRNAEDKTVSPGGIILRVIILVVAFCVLIAVLAFALKLAFMLAALVGILLCGIGAFFIFKKLFMQNKTEVVAIPSETKLWSPEGTVHVFKEEPKVHQLVDKSLANQHSKTLIVTSDAQVTVLEESDIALRIKLTSGAHKGQTGWVDKAHVSGYSSKRM